MNSFRVVCCFFALLAAVGASQIYSHNQRASSAEISVPPLIDLGECDEGVNVETSFPIANTGGLAVSLYEFSTSCACTKATVSKGDEIITDGVVALSPGEIINVRLQVHIRKNDGGNVRERVSFNSDIPDKRQNSISIEAKIRGGVYAFPQSVFFVGSDKTVVPEQRVTIVDWRNSSSRGPLELVDLDDRVVASPLAIVKEPSEFLQRSYPGANVYEMRLSLRTPVQPVEFSSTGKVLDASKSVLTKVPLSVKVRPSFFVQPTRLVFPRQGENGEKVFQAKAICSFDDSGDWTLHIKGAPSGLRATVLPSLGGKSKLLVVECTEEAVKAIGDALLELEAKGSQGQVATTKVLVHMEHQ